MTLDMVTSDQTGSMVADDLLFSAIDRSSGSSAVSTPATARRKPNVDRHAIEAAVRTILEAVGEDPDCDGLLGRSAGPDQSLIDRSPTGES